MKKVTKSKSPNKNKFKKMVRDSLNEWETLNPKNAAKFYAKDSTLIFYDFSPLKYTGWAAYEKGTTKDFGGLKKLSVKMNDDFKAIGNEDMVVTMETLAIILYPKKGKPIRQQGRHTILWKNRKDNWLIFHEHYSNPAPQ